MYLVPGCLSLLGPVCLGAQCEQWVPRSHFLTQRSLPHLAQGSKNMTQSPARPIVDALAVSPACGVRPPVNVMGLVSSARNRAAQERHNLSLSTMRFQRTFPQFGQATQVTKFSPLSPTSYDLRISPIFGVPTLLFRAVSC